MDRQRFRRLVEEALDRLPEEFQQRLENVAVLVEDLPPDDQPRPHAPRPRSMRPRKLLLGVFEGIPATKRSLFNIVTGPARIVLFQKNIEAVCRSEEEMREQVLLTVMHEIGHYFGMSEDQLRDV